MQTLDQFFQKYNGKRVDYDGKWPGECKDLFSFYNRDVVGNPSYVYGDAWKLYNASPREYYQKVSTPRKGDVAIWKKSFGGFGHVAIVWDGGKFFSQNYPLGAPCSLQSIPTSQLTGYLRPKNMSALETIKQAQQQELGRVTDPMVVIGYNPNDPNDTTHYLVRTGDGKRMKLPNLPNDNPVLKKYLSAWMEKEGTRHTYSVTGQLPDGGDY